MPLAKPDIFNAPCVYRELGCKLGRLEKFERSLPYFDQALQRSTEDIRALLGRARCRAQTCKYEEALKDLEIAHSLYPENIYTYASECLVKYLCCEFEEALVENRVRIPLRKMPDNFVLGAMHCEDAIRNNIGSRAGNPLRDHFLIIRKLAWKRVYEKSIPYQPQSRFKRKKKEWTDETNLLAAPKHKFSIPGDQKIKKERRPSVPSIESGSTMRRLDIEGTANVLNEDSSILESLNSVVEDRKHRMPPMKDYPFRPIQRYTSNIRNLMAERYLEKMFDDKIFLRKLKKHNAVKSPNNAGAEKIEGLVRKSSKYIHYNQELLRARRPFFLLRFQDSKGDSKMKQLQLERENMLIKYSETQAQNMIEKLKAAVADYNLRQVIEMADKMYEFCENRPKRIFPNRSSYLAQLYALVRDGFYETRSFRASMTNEEKEARVAVVLGLPNELCSTDYLQIQFKGYFVDKKKLSRITEERIKNSTTREELVWLYHKLSRLQFELKQFELSKAYATKCLRECYILKDNKWILNGMFLMVKIQVALKNKNGAIIELKGCRKMAKKMEDDNMERFIKYCMDVLIKTEMEFIQPSKMLQGRTREIMKLMTTDSLRMKAQLVFQRINALPPSKRLSVLPGIRYVPSMSEDKESNIGKKLDGKKLQPRTHKEDRRGINFMELM